MTGTDENGYKVLESKIDALIETKIYTITKIVWYGDTKYDANTAFYQRLTHLIISKIKTKHKNRIALNLFNQSEQWKKPKVCILDSTYSDFEQKFPFLCDNNKVSTDPNTDCNSAKSELLMDFISIYMAKKMKIKNMLKVYPSQIIDDQYFLGNANHCSDEIILRNLKITHIINCTATLNNEFERMPSTQASISSLSLQTDPSFVDVETKETDGDDDDPYSADYIRVPVNDCPNQKIIKYFISAIKFIEGALSANDGCIKNRILCHCHAGISRSTTITISYLMYSRNLSLNDALIFVRARREIINPNQGFRCVFFSEITCLCISCAHYMKLSIV